MANHPSAEKRNRQRVCRTDRNRSIKATMRTVVKRARTALSTNETVENRTAAVADAVKSVDRAAAKGVIHPKKAARTKSRLAKQAYKRAKATAAP